MKNVVIIGAGPAGLTAAYELLKRSKDYNVVILEKSDRVGGISQTVKYNSNRMDIGGHRFFSKDKRVTDWWESIMPTQGALSIDDIKLEREKPLSENGPDPEQVDRVMLIRDRVSRIYYNNHFFDYPVSLKWDTIKNMGFFTTMKAGFSYFKSCIHKLPENSLENFYINRFGRVLYSMFFEGYTEKLWGRHPRDISADWGSQRVKGLSIRAVIKDMFSKILGTPENAKVETSLIEQFSYPKFGPGQLWETVLQIIKDNGGKVLFDCDVEHIEIDKEENKVTFVEFSHDKRKLKISADLFISSMPLKDLVDGINDSEMPENVAMSGHELPYRDFVTIGLLVDKLKIKNMTDKKTLNNIVPDCWIYVQDTSVKLGRIQIFNNWSPYMVANPENTVWIGLEYFCNEGDDFWNLSDDDAIQFAISELEKIGVISSDDVIDSHRERIQKAYPAYFDSYKHIDEIVEYLNNFENLYCVGRNGQHRYNNMDHSMVTSFETVDNILNNVKGKTNIWNVNTDKEYHETKENE